MNRSILLVMCDVLVLSAMSLSSGGFGSEGQKSSDGIPDYGQLRLKAKALETRLRYDEKKMSQAKKELNEMGKKVMDAEKETDKAEQRAEESENARTQAEQAKKDAEQRAEKSEKARTQAEQAKKDAEQRAEEFDNARTLAMKAQEEAEEENNELKKMNEELKRKVEGYVEREKEETNKYNKIMNSGWTVQYDGARRSHSPLITIVGIEGVYVVGICSEKELKQLNTVRVYRGYEKEYTVESVWQLKGQEKSKIYFFEVSGLAEDSSCLKFGAPFASEGSDKYLFSVKDGHVEVARPIDFTIGGALESYGAMAIGDMLLDKETGAVVEIASSIGWVGDRLKAKSSISGRSHVSPSDLRWVRNLQ